MGIGGTPEGVIAAAALRCLGGEIVARLGLATKTSAVASLSSGSTRREC